MDDRPIPRFWWLKRLTALTLVLIVSVVSFHVWLGWYVERQRLALIEEWRGDGLPHPDDLARITGVAPDTGNNPAVLINAAAASMPDMTAAQKEHVRSGFDTVYERRARAADADFGSTFAEQLNLLSEAALATEEADFGMPLFNRDVADSSLGAHRQLSMLLGYDADARLHAGDSLGAIRRLVEVTHLGEAAQHLGYGILADAVGFGVEAWAAALAVELIAYPIDASQPLDAWAAAEPEVRNLIARLLIDRKARASKALAVDRVEVIMQAAETSSPSTWRERWMTERLRTTSLLHKARLASVTSPLLAQAETFPDARRLAEAIGVDSLKERRRPATLAGCLFNGGRRTAIQGAYRWMARGHFVTTAQHRLTATALAIKLYQADHDGRLPNTLEDLVPGYLPDVPIDPFADGSQPIGYRPDALIPLVYSVWEDGIDQGGSQRRQGDRTWFGPVNKWRTLDRVVPLEASPDPDVDPWTYLFDGGRRAQAINPQR